MTKEDKTMETETGSPSIHIHIQPDPPVTDLKLRQIWNYRDLIFIFTKNQFSNEGRFG